MTPLEILDDTIERRRVFDLSMSLYECLYDLLSDLETIDQASDDDAGVVLDRIEVSAMNCLADMRLLIDPFENLIRHRFEYTVT